MFGWRCVKKFPFHRRNNYFDGDDEDDELGGVGADNDKDADIYDDELTLIYRNFDK
jgi:hypothetical protein